MLRNLDEIYAGVCDGMTYEEIEANYPEEFALRNGAFLFPSSINLRASNLRAIGLTDGSYFCSQLLQKTSWATGTRAGNPTWTSYPASTRWYRSWRATRNRC